MGEAGEKLIRERLAEKGYTDRQDHEDARRADGREILKVLAGFAFLAFLAWRKFG